MKGTIKTTMAKRKQHQPGDGTYGNGTISQRGDRFRVRWYEDGRQQSSSGHKSRAEAVDKLKEIQARLELGQPGVELVATVAAPKTDRHADHLDDFIAYRVAHKRRMAAEDRSRWELHLAPALAITTINGVTSSFVSRLAQELVNPTHGSAKEAISGPTATRVLALLSAFYRWAQRDDVALASSNPVRKVLSDGDIKSMLASTYDKTKRRTLRSWDEVDRLYSAMPRTSVGLAFYLGARAGLRPGEAVALRWGSVDLERSVMSVSRSVRSGKEGPTKSGKPRRVPLSPKLAGELSAWRDLVPHADTDLVCPPPARTKRDGTKGGSMGTYLGKRSIGVTLRAAFKAAKVKPAEMYAIGRHTFGTLVGQSAGMAAPKLQAIMGHANISTTLRYINETDGLTEKELAALGG